MIAARLLSVLLLAALASACAAPPHKPYDPAVRDGIHSIGLLPPAVSERTSVRLMVHPSEGLGMVGMVIAEGDMSAKSANFSNAMRAQGYRCRVQFRDSLMTSLRGAGYEVRSLDLARAAGDQEFMDRYPVADGKVDAYLDLYSDLIGYAAVGVNTPYRPTVHLTARLIRARDLKVLWQDRIAYNDLGEGNAVTIQPVLGYQFGAYEELMANPARALEGLNVALRATGDELARQLR